MTNNDNNVMKENIGYIYESKVFESIASCGIGGVISNNAKSSTGADLDFKINDVCYNLEVKNSISDYMGSGILSGNLYDLQLSESLRKMDGNISKYIVGKINEKRGLFVKVFDDIVSMKYDIGVDDGDFIGKSAVDKFVRFGYNKFPVVTTSNAWNYCGNKGTNSRRQADMYGKNNSIVLDSRFVVDLYNNKNVFYIQIGGHGLYYLGKDPASLNEVGVNSFDVPKVNIEVRMGAYGRKSGMSKKMVNSSIKNNNFLSDKERAWLLNKLEEDPKYFRSAALRVSARVDNKLSIEKSAYSLDSKDSVSCFLENIQKCS